MKRLYKRPTDLIHTERHDAIHVWLANEVNRKKVLTKVFIDSIKDGDDVSVYNKENERPIYGIGGKYLVGIVDCLMFCELTQYSGNKWKCIVLCEFKPDLVRLSELLGQIRIYRDHIHRMYNNPIIPVLFTFDKNERFDSVLTESGIRVYRINEQETEKVGR